MKEDVRDYEYLISSLAKGLIEHCNNWGYDFVDNLMAKPTEDNFIKQFCKITYDYYFKNDGDTYGARFVKKDEIVQIYKCGREPNKILLECPIERVIKEIQGENQNEATKKTD